MYRIMCVVCWMFFISALLGNPESCGQWFAKARLAYIAETNGR